MAELCFYTVNFSEQAVDVSGYQRGVPACSASCNHFRRLRKGQPCRANNYFSEEAFRGSDGMTVLANIYRAKLAEAGVGNFDPFSPDHIEALFAVVQQACCPLIYYLE